MTSSLQFSHRILDHRVNQASSAFTCNMMSTVSCLSCQQQQPLNRACYEFSQKNAGLHAIMMILIYCTSAVNASLESKALKTLHNVAAVFIPVRKETQYLEKYQLNKVDRKREDEGEDALHSNLGIFVCCAEQYLHRFCDFHNYFQITNERLPARGFRCRPNLCTDFVEGKSSRL